MRKEVAEGDRRILWLTKLPQSMTQNAHIQKRLEQSTVAKWIRLVVPIASARFVIPNCISRASVFTYSVDAIDTAVNWQCTTVSQGQLDRLNVIELDMESLSNRSADILPIANGLVRQLATEFARPARGFSAEAEQALLAYRWPGNIRELRNVIERCVLLTKGDTISVEHMPNRVTEGSIPAAVTESAQPDGRLLTLDELEEAHIRRVLVASQSIEEAATILGIDQTTLYRRRKRYGLL